MKIKSKIMSYLLMIGALASAAKQNDPMTIKVRHRATILDLMPETHKITRDVWDIKILPYLELSELPKKVWAKSFNYSVVLPGMMAPKKDVLTQDEINQLDLNLKLLKKERIVFAQYSPNHAYIYIIYDSGLHTSAYIWNMQTKQQEHTEYGQTIESLQQAEFSKDSKKFMRVEQGYNRLLIYNMILAGSRPIFSYPDRTVIEHHSGIIQAHFIGNDQEFITLSKDGIIRIWDTDGKILNELKPAVNGLNQFVVSDDGSKIIVQESKDLQRIWQSSFGKLTLEQWIFIWVVDEYYNKLLKLNPKHRNKVLKLIAHLRHIDIDELYRVFYSFSPENQRILHEAYEFDLPNLERDHAQNCCIIS